VSVWDAVVTVHSGPCLATDEFSYLPCSHLSLIVWDTRTILDLPIIAGSFAMAAALGLGVGL
jgi:hypothetical protein